MLSRIREMKALGIINVALAELETKITIVANNIADLGPDDPDPTAPLGNEPSLLDMLNGLHAQERRLLQEKHGIEDGTKLGICENCFAVILQDDPYLTVHKDTYCAACVPQVVKYEVEIESVLTVGELIKLLSKFDRNLPVVTGAENHYQPNRAVSDVQGDPHGWPVLCYGDTLDNSERVREEVAA